MPRPTTSGRYAVPPHVLALKPKDIPCTVKAISAPSKAFGSTVHYYVYELLTVPDPRNPGKHKKNSGPCLGKVEDGMFCPNKRGIERLGEKCAIESTPEPIPEGSTADPASDAHEKDNAMLKQAASNMNLGLKDIDIQVKDYGEYAAVLSSTMSVLECLNRHFSVQDARLIYALGVIYFVNEYTPAGYVGDVFRQSVLSNKWSTLAISENTVNDFLKLLGRHPVVCEKYSQELIDNGSGLTALDGHVILSCSGQNCLADYGNKYRKIGNKQLNILEAYDAEREVPLASKAYEGGLPDKSSVQDLLAAYAFPSRTVFLVDMGFYSEENIGLYREGGKHFVVPVPENTSIFKPIQSSRSYEGSFSYTKADGDGAIRSVTVLYRETTVSELEDAYQKILDERIERKNQSEAAECRDGEKPKKHYSRKVKRSDYGGDRVIICRDEAMHKKMVDEYLSQIGSDDEHTSEKLEELAPGFGVIVLRTNLDKEQHSPSDVYCKYKKRWRLETHYNFVENIVRFCGLKTEDYYSMQGLSFLIQVVGQIKSDFMKKMKSSPSKYVSHLSVKECLVKAGHLKLSQHMDGKWRVSITTKKIAELMEQMGVDVKSDVQKLNLSQF